MKNDNRILLTGLAANPIGIVQVCVSIVEKDKKIYFLKKKLNVHSAYW